MTNILLKFSLLGIFLFPAYYVQAQVLKPIHPPPPVTSTLVSTKFSADAHCLAETMYYEARGESLAGQRAVGEVIMNRVRAGFAPTACAVVNQKVGNVWQFGFKKTHPAPIPRKIEQHFLELAQTVLNRGDDFVLPPSVLYFNNTPFNPTQYTEYCKIGHQFFYTRRGRHTT